MSRRPNGQRAGSELTVEELILTRDWVRLRQVQLLAVPLDPIPIGVIGKVVGIGPEAALIRFRSKYPPTYVKFSELERASFVDLMPVRAQIVVRRVGGWVATGIGAAALAAIGFLVGRVFGK